MPLTKGDKLGPYEIIGLIGQGGMGEVYRAFDPRLRRDVAIKTSAGRFTERFQREAHAIAAFNHPNICQIYDVGPDYLVMELIDGPTLRERIKQGAIGPDEALRIAGQIAVALGAAHEKHITHRDLKPDNIKISNGGAVKVLDFGLAKLGATQAAGNSEESATRSMSLTQSGSIMGTAAYMSPEQARGKLVDARSDIWAFGVVLYEMVTTCRPFNGDDFTDTLASIVKDVPDLSLAPRRFQRLLDACLQKDPAHRLQAIGDYRLLLLDPERPRFQWLWPGIAVATTAASAFLAWLHLREVPPALPNLRYELTRSGDSGFVEPELSPDGRYLAFVARSGDSSRLFVRPLDSLEDREFPGSDGVTYPFWSPDSQHIAFFSQGKLKQVPLGGGPATVIAPAPDGRGGTWGQDGTIVFAPSVTGTLSRVAAAGGAATPMQLPRAGSSERDSLRFPVFLPNSDRFFYTIEATALAGEGVYVGSLNGAPPVRILPDLSVTRFVSSSGSGTHGFIFFKRQNTLMAQPFEAASLKTAGDAFPIADYVKTGGNTGFADFTVSAGGTLIYSAGTDLSREREIVWLDRRGEHGKSIVKKTGITDFALSPDNTRLLYSLGDQVVFGDLWLRDLASGVSQRFTFGPSSAYAPLWSPDGETAAFTMYPEDQMYVRKASSAKEEAWNVRGTNTFLTSWSADGKLIAFSQQSPTTKEDLWLLPLEGDRKPRLFKQTPYSERSGQISPDGRWIAYSSNQSGQYEILVEPIEPGDAPRQVSVEGGVSPQWRADGRELYFIADNTKMMVVDVVPGPHLSFNTPRELFREPALVSQSGSSGNTYQPSRDAKQFLVLATSGGTPSNSPPLTVITNWRAALAGKANR